MKHYTPKIPKLRIYFSADKEYDQSFYEIKKQIREAIRAALFYENVDFDVELSVKLCSNDYIRELNRTYREKDAPTDVLSFPMWEASDIEEGAYEDGHAVMLGDIILSVEKARAQAEEYGHSIRRELAFLSVHSTLHLLGYDHEVSEEDEKYMNEKQEEILTRIGQPRK